MNSHDAHTDSPTNSPTRPPVATAPEATAATSSLPSEPRTRRISREVTLVILALLVAGLSYAQRLATLEQAYQTGVPRPPEPSTLSLLWYPSLTVAGILLMLLRHRIPLVAAVATVLLATVFSLPAVGVAAVCCVTSLATRRRLLDAVVVGAVALGGLAYSRLTGIPQGVPWLAVAPSLLLPLLVLAAAWAWGMYLGARRARNTSLREKTAARERELAADVEHARLGERERIALELTESLTERISLLSEHADHLARQQDRPAGERRAVATLVRSDAEDAVTQLRDVLGTLRSDQAVTTVPSLGLASLTELIERTRRAGTPVEIAGVLPDLDALPTATGRAAYLVLQEVLANAHAQTPRMPVTVLMAGEEGADLTLTVRTPLLGEDGATSEAGATRDLDAAARRIGLAEGTVRFGQEGDRFVVRAELPWRRS